MACVLLIRETNERTTTTASFALKFNYVIYTQKKKNFISESNAVVNSNFDKTFADFKCLLGKPNRIKRMQAFSLTFEQ